MKHENKQCSCWCATCGGICKWRGPNGVLALQDSLGPSDAKVCWAHAPPQGACENLVFALKFMANQQTGRSRVY